MWVFLLTLFARLGGSLDLSGELVYFLLHGCLLMNVRFTSMFDNVGIAASSGVVAALIMGAGFFPTVFLQWQGKRWYSHDTEKR